METNETFQGNMEHAFVIKVKKDVWSLVFTSLIYSYLHFVYMQVRVVHLENSQLGFFFNLVTCLMRQACELAPSLSITFHQALIFDYLFTIASFTFIIQFVFIQKQICKITKAEKKI